MSFHASSFRGRSFRGRSFRAAGLAATTAIVAGAVTGPARAADEPPRADVALVATPSAVEFAAQRGAGVVRLNYFNPGTVTKVGATITAVIPAGLTVQARPAAGWACHIDDWPSLVCDTDTTLAPGQVVFPAEVVLRADTAGTRAMEFGTLGFYREPTENPADNYSTVMITVTAP